MQAVTKKSLVVVVASQKGGVGKTTLVIHLAVAAQQADLVPLIFDIDPQASAYQWFKSRQPKPKEEAEEGRQEPVLPFVKSLQAVELADAIRRPHGADLIIIDTPPSTDPATLTAAEEADLVLIPLKPSILDLQSVTNTVRMSRMAGKEPLLVFTMIEPRSNIHEEFGEKIRASKLDFCPYGTGQRVAYNHGLIKGLTALEFDPTGKAAQEIDSLFAYLCKHLELQPTQRGKRHAQKTGT